MWLEMTHCHRVPVVRVFAVSALSPLPGADEILSVSPSVSPCLVTPLSTHTFMSIFQIKLNVMYLDFVLYVHVCHIIHQPPATTLMLSC